MWGDTDNETLMVLYTNPIKLICYGGLSRWCLRSPRQIFTTLADLIDALAGSPHLSDHRGQGNRPWGTALSSTNWQHFLAKSSETTFMTLVPLLLVHENKSVRTATRLNWTWWDILGLNGTFGKFWKTF